jgi:parallel beta-helix repeat protein
VVSRLAFSRRGALLGVLAGVLAVGFVGSASASSVTSLTSCQDITSPGKYRLDADVTATGCFRIFADDVTLHLNGHTITEAAPATGDGIDVFGSRDSVVGPGTITGTFGLNIDLAGGDSVVGVSMTTAVDGILIGGSGNSVRGNVVTGNFGYGIAAVGGGNTIVGNSVHGNGLDDLFDNNPGCDSNVWKGNDFGTANLACIH